MLRLPSFWRLTVREAAALTDIRKYMIAKLEM
jgi:hypothetical protein